jgi:hypothetical protein
MWDALKAAIIRLRDEQPGALTGHPGLRDDDQRPPFAIMLAAWATDLAAELHRQFGDDVELTVGGMAYPTGERTHIPASPPSPPRSPPNSTARSPSPPATAPRTACSSPTTPTRR